MTSPRIEVPAALAASYARSLGEEGRAWTAALPGLVAELLDRWDDVVARGDVRRVVRRRFDVLTGVLGLDRERAAGWTLGRLLQNALWDIEDGEPALAPAALVTAESLRGPQPRARS